MQEIKTKAIVLNTRDFGEADKIASLFSLEYGKIPVKFNGVRKEKAKLKPLIQPFTFIEAECMKRGDFFTIKTGSVINNFPKIVSDFNRTICAYIVIEIIDKILIKNKVEPEIFLSLVKCLQSLEEINPYQATIEFIKEFFDLLGEKLNTDLTSPHIFLDLNLGNFIESKSYNSIEIDKKCYQVLSEPTENDRLNKMCLKMLNNIFKAKYDVELNSFSFI